MTREEMAKRLRVTPVTPALDLAMAVQDAVLEDAKAICDAFEADARKALGGCRPEETEDRACHEHAVNCARSIKGRIGALGDRAKASR